jgi:hypothetical protein
MGLNKIITGIVICLAIGAGKSNANLIDPSAWTKTGNVSGDSLLSFYLLVSSTGTFGGTPSASISQTINTTPGDSYEVQFFSTGFSLTHPFDDIGLFQFGSSTVTFAGKDDHNGGTSRFDSTFVATGDTTFIEVSFAANPAYDFLQASIDGPFSGSVMNVVDLPETFPTSIMLSLGLFAVFVAKRFTGLKPHAENTLNS